MVDAKNYTKKEIGNQAFIWGVPGQVSDRIMISAHGGPTLGSGPQLFSVPAGMRLFFYGPHGVALQDPDYDAILIGRYPPYEVISAGEIVNNYGLWKWQGYHYSLSGSIFGKPAQMWVKDIPESYQQIIDLYDTKHFATQSPLADAKQKDFMDMLTIRYRPFRVHTNLYSLICQLVDSASSYKDIHCNFCRGITGSHDASMNAHPAHDRAFKDANDF